MNEKIKLDYIEYLLYMYKINYPYYIEYSHFYRELCERNINIIDYYYQNLKNFFDGAFVNKIEILSLSEFVSIVRNENIKDILN